MNKKISYKHMIALRLTEAQYVFLKRVSSDSNMSEYIRALIEEDMKKGEKYDGIHMGRSR